MLEKIQMYGPVCSTGSFNVQRVTTVKTGVIRNKRTETHEKRTRVFSVRFPYTIEHTTLEARELIAMITFAGFYVVKTLYKEKSFMNTNRSTWKDVVANSAHWIANTAQAQVANFSYNLLKKYSRWEVFADGQS